MNLTFRVREASQNVCVLKARSQIHVDKIWLEVCAWISIAKPYKRKSSAGSARRLKRYVFERHAQKSTLPKCGQENEPPNLVSIGKKIAVLSEYDWTFTLTTHRLGNCAFELDFYKFPPSEPQFLSLKTIPKKANGEPLRSESLRQTTRLGLLGPCPSLTDK